jgi:hypothetical protein
MAHKNKSRHYAAFLILIFSIICASFIYSCKDENNKAFTSDIVFPDSSVSFSNHVEPLFMQTCVATGCHGRNQTAANLNLEDDMWHSLMNTPGLVVPKHSDNSTLVQHLEGKLPLMPPRQPLKTNQVTGVKKWIDEGALYN